jgi:hypothetical protein
MVPAHGPAPQTTGLPAPAASGERANPLRVAGRFRSRSVTLDPGARAFVYPPVVWRS